MNINIDYATRTPVYEQIVNNVERLVTLNILKPGDQIPSIRELACTLAINPNTVKKAYDILITRNIIISKSTKGCFISETANNIRTEKVESLLEEIEEKIKELENYGMKKSEIAKKLKF